MTDTPFDNEPAENVITALTPEVVETPGATTFFQQLAVETAMIDESVAFINETAAAVANAAVAIGEHLLTRFFNNDIELATSKNPYKQVSYKMLCEHPDLMIKRRELGIMMRVAAQERFFRSIELDTRMLTYTHKSYLTRLPDDETKSSLVTECIETPIPTRELYNRISEIQNQAEPETSRSAEQLYKENMTMMDRAMEKILIPDIFQDPNAIAGLTGQARADLKQKAVSWVNDLETFKAQCEILIQTLDRLDR